MVSQAEQLRVDVERLRSDTPGVGRVIHLNNAGSALPPESVIETVVDHLRLEATWGGYEAGYMAEDAMQQVYEAVAELLGGTASQVALTDSATRSFDMLFYSIDLQPGDRIITIQTEFATNYLGFLHRSKQVDVDIVIVPLDSAGHVDLEALDKELAEGARLLLIDHIPNYCGVVQPAAEIGRLAKKHGVTFILDVTQSAGQLPLSAVEIGCDAMFGTSRKWLRGPRGMGFIWASESLMPKLQPPILTLRSAVWSSLDDYELVDDARRFEMWESSLALKLGFGEAVRYALNCGIPALTARIQSLNQLFRDGLQEIPSVTIADWGLAEAGITTFDVAGIDADDIVDRLRTCKVNMSMHPANYALLDFTRRERGPLVRTSAHAYNTEEEILRALELLRGVVNKPRVR
jgi:cysteine desulfurase / selenocysteine lyase